MNSRLLLVRLVRTFWLGMLAICIGLLISYPGFTPPDRDVASVNALQLVPTPTPFRNPTPTPPTPGGHGHDLFYIYCMPCHGDQGQGLTDEFRNRQYPPEDTNCWKSGCHGNQPYANGFQLPHTVPALIGPNTLTKFATARNMYDFMHTAMPFNKPGSLSDVQYLQVLAFLLEQNHIVPQGVQLEADTLQNIVLRPAATLTPASPAAVQTPTVDGALIVGAGAIILFACAATLWISIRRRRTV
jgi:mono/diheme cytochrome c family protein